MATRPKSTSSTTRNNGRSYAKPTGSSRPSSRAQQLLEQQALADKRQIVGQYMLGKTIGEGTFGKVKLAAHMPTGEKVAVKILEKSRIKEAADVRRVNREIKILKKARHPNVIQLYEVLDTQNAIYLIMECCDGGEMFDFIVSQKRVNEVQACKFFHQIVEGVDEIHKNEITHRDLKPENLLLKASTDGWIVKVVDFGLSNTHEGNRLLSTACGSPCYAAPEMIAGKKYVGPLADIWSMGVILFALVCGYLPFEDPNTAVLYKKILAGDYKAPKFISPEVRDLIARILETDPRRRYTMQDIRQHVWYTMVPEADIPKESVDVYNDERTRTDTVATLGQAGIDAQALLDGLASHACNSLTAMYYLYEQKQRNLRAKNNNQQQSRIDLPKNPSDVSGAAVPTTTSRQPSTGAPPSSAGNNSTNNPPSINDSNINTAAAGVPTTTSNNATVSVGPPPSSMPIHGVYRPAPPGQTPLVFVNNNNNATIVDTSAAPTTTNANTTTPATTTISSTAPSANNRSVLRPVVGGPNNPATNNSNTNGAGAPAVSLNMGPYLAAPPLVLQQQQRLQQQNNTAPSPTVLAHKQINNNNANINNMPSLDLYLKQGGQLPSIQQNNNANNSNNPATTSLQRPLVVPPLQFSQQQQLQAHQKPVIGGGAGGSQSARAPTNNNTAILGSLTARPNASQQPPTGAKSVVHQNNIASNTANSGTNNTNVNAAPGSLVPAQQQQLLAVNQGEVPMMVPTALAGPDTESSGGRPNTRRSRVRSRGVPGMGQLDDEATNGMGPAIGSLDEPDSLLSQPMQQMQIQPMDGGVMLGQEDTIPTPITSPVVGSSVRTGGNFNTFPTDNAATAAAPANTAAAKQPTITAPEQPSAARASSAQGGRRGRNLVPAVNSSTSNKAQVAAEAPGAAVPAATAASTTPALTAQQQQSAREEASRNKAQQQNSFMLS